MMMGFGFIIFLVFAGVVVVAAVGIGKLLFSNNTSLSNIFSGSAKKTSREILEERFVRGEISREEFELMKAEIAK
ncbi:MAG TPA: SHOCT domain-containing protein [Pelolinea sp.]|nr:SHOCT domain-containing protein [Pelolinea sp.]